MSSKKSTKASLKKITKEDKASYLKLIGFLLILIALFIILNIFSPVLKAELKYQLISSNSKSEELITPMDSDFSILIPKLNINTKVIKNINPFNSKEYQQALTKGVVHAKTSATPDLNGNTFIFAHSAGDWYQANQYNAIFYLLNKLQKGDEIDIYYQDQEYHYQVDQLKFINSDQVDYLSYKSFDKQLTLMTCWPPGTTLKRLIVIAIPKND